MVQAFNRDPDVHGILVQVSAVYVQHRSGTKIIQPPTCTSVESGMHCEQNVLWGANWLSDD